MQDNGWIDEKGIEAMEKKIEDVVNECVKFAEESPWPDDSEVYKDIYVDQDYPFIKD